MHNQNSEKLKDYTKIVDYWKDSSNEDFAVMLKLFDSKSYNWSLFLGHIATEKMLKAFYVKTHKKHPPFIHNLYRLAELSELDITEEQADYLDEITSFNINARYDDYKKEFYQKCTLEYTEIWIENIKKIKSWIEQKL